MLIIKKVNIFNFDAHNLIDISGMFLNCKSLEEINMFKFNKNKIKNIDMFSGCLYKLKRKLKNKIKI